MAKEKKDKTTPLKVKIAELFIDREKLTLALNQTNQQLQTELNKLQQLQEKQKE